MSDSSRVRSRAVARQPKQPKPGEAHRLHIILPGELVEEIDRIAEQMTAARPGMTVTRTDVARIAINEFVARNPPEAAAKKRHR